MIIPNAADFPIVDPAGRAAPIDRTPRPADGPSPRIDFAALLAAPPASWPSVPAAPPTDETAGPDAVAPAAETADVEDPALLPVGVLWLVPSPQPLLSAAPSGTSPDGPAIAVAPRPRPFAVTLSGQFSDITQRQPAPTPTALPPRSAHAFDPAPAPVADPPFMPPLAATLPEPPPQTGPRKGATADHDRSAASERPSDTPPQRQGTPAPVLAVALRDRPAPAADTSSLADPAEPFDLLSSVSGSCPGPSSAGPFAHHLANPAHRAEQASQTSQARPDSAGPPSAEQQIIAAFRTSPGGRTEILLDPRDLGHIRLSLEGDETAMVLSIQADRSDTADLLRRNVDLLLQEFREAGYTNLSFSFADRGSDQTSSNVAPASGDESAPGPAPDAADPVRPAPLPLGTQSLDLRM